MSKNCKKHEGKNYKGKKGNISILVILVLLASSIMGVLTMHFVRQILDYNGTILSYYKSYYLAKAGLELSLTQVNYRDVGFQYSVHSGDFIIKNNFQCNDCYFITNISGTTNFLNKFNNSNINLNNNSIGKCTLENSFKLYSGQTLVIPLYTDIYPFVNNIDVFGKIKTKNLLSLSSRFNIDFVGEQFSKQIGISLATTPTDLITLSKKYDDLDQNIINDFLQYKGYPDDVNINKRYVSTYKNYLIISNPSTKDDILNFCISSKKQDGKPLFLPTESSYIKSIGNFGDRTLSLEGIYHHNVLPNFLGHTSLEF